MGIYTKDYLETEKDEHLIVNTNSNKEEFYYENNSSYYESNQQNSCNNFESNEINNIMNLKLNNDDFDDSKYRNFTKDPK